MKKIKGIIISVLLLIALVVCINFTNSTILGDEVEILEPIPLPFNPQP